MKKINEQEFIDICRTSVSMSEASNKLGMHFNTFKKYALELGCYNPNQSGKGIKKSMPKRVPTEDILNGKYPNFQTYKLKVRLINEGYIEDKCCLCGWDKKRPGEKFSTCELHHKDGNRTNHKLENLQLICPNCHSLTLTYRGLNSANNLSI